MPVVPDPAVELMPRMAMSWLSTSKVTPGVNLATSAKDLIPWMSILAAVNALMLSGTLLSASSLRVAVTITSPTLVASAEAWVPPGPAAWAKAPPAQSSGISAAEASHGRRRDRLVVIGSSPLWIAGENSYPAVAPSIDCDHNFRRQGRFVGWRGLCAQAMLSAKPASNQELSLI